MSRLSRPLSFLLLGVLASGTGCVGGQTGHEGESQGCVEQSRELAAAEASPLGFSAATVLGFAEGGHSATLAWQRTKVPYGPEQGEGELTLTLQSLGRARFVQRQGQCCVDALLIDVRVNLKTSGGALDETFVAVLEAQSAHTAFVTMSIKPPLGGSLAFDQQALGNTHLAQLDLDVRFDGAKFAGALRAGFETNSSSSSPEASVGFMSEQMASWGEHTDPVWCGL